MLILATMISTNVWAAAPKLSDMSFSTSGSVRIVNEDFSGVSTTTPATATVANTVSQSAYGIFNYMYNNNTSNSYAILNNSATTGFNSNCVALSAGSGSPLIFFATGISFGNKGAWRIKTTKTSHNMFGIYGAKNNNACTHSETRAFIQNDGGTIKINSSGGWTSVTTVSSEENIIDICVIYNKSGSTQTYGNSISISNNKAHVYVNGDCVATGDNPTEFSISSTALDANALFKILPMASSGNKCYIDDIQVWNALPGAGKTLSSIAKKTNATKTTYIEGETFNPAGLVITATYSDASTEDIAYTGNEAKFSFSPSTATALTTGNSSVTVTYGGQTCSQSITVRSITLQAKDEDGNAIPGGGPGAPTFTAATRTITAAANAGNYVFKEWVVSNASATSTTTTPTTITSAAPTGNVTVTAKYYKPISVSWMVKGVAWTPAQLGTSAVGYNTAWSALTLPTDPTTGDGCGNKFMGWVTETIETPLDKTDDAAAISALNILNSGNKSGKTTKITTTTTFHAVFADYAE